MGTLTVTGLDAGQRVRLYGLNSTNWYSVPLLVESERTATEAVTITLPSVPIADVFVIVTHPDGEYGACASPLLTLNGGESFAWTTWRDRPRTGRFTPIFDDFDVSQYEFGLPILREFGMRCVQAVITQMSTYGNEAPWWQVRAFKAEGHLIGSHSATHSAFGHDATDAAYQVPTSYNDLVREVPGFADQDELWYVYPGGSFFSDMTLGKALLQQYGFDYVRRGNGWATIPPAEWWNVGANGPYKPGAQWCADNGYWRTAMFHQWGYNTYTDPDTEYDYDVDDTANTRNELAHALVSSIAYDQLIPPEVPLYYDFALNLADVIASGAGSLTLDLAVAASGSTVNPSTVSGAGTLTLDLAVAGAGSVTSAGGGSVSLDLAVSGIATVVDAESRAYDFAIVMTEPTVYGSGSIALDLRVSAEFIESAGRGPYTLQVVSRDTRATLALDGDSEVTLRLSVEDGSRLVMEVE